MPPETMKMGLESATFMPPSGLALLFVMSILILILPRRYALLPIFVLICYMTGSMRFVLFTLDFTLLRIIVVVGWIRLIFRRELNPIKLNPLDKVLIAWAIVSIVTHTLLWGGNFDAFRYKLGTAYNAIAFYFLFRFLLRGDKDEIVRALRMYAVLVVPLAGLMIMEKMTGRNPFFVFGGVPEMTAIRDGALRCQGPFSHPILAGTFGATLMPLFVGLWWQGGKNRIYAFPALCAAVVITIASASSGPIMALACGALALALWVVRQHMRMMRWAIALGMILLQIVMKAPIWFLVGRVGVVAGSAGYHRAYLIDRAFANLPGWWLVGTRSTWDWADHDARLFDVTNEYIANGADGGLITMILFITIIVLGFKVVGRAVHALKGHEFKKSVQLAWAMGAALFAHAMTYLSVSYFDQNSLNWFLLLAMISTFGGSLLLVSRREFFSNLHLQADTPNDSPTSRNLVPLVPHLAPNRDSRFQPKVDVRLGEIPKLRS